MAYNSGRPVLLINLLTNADPMFKTATNSGYTQNEEWHMKKTITRVKAVFNAYPGIAYPYPTQTWAVITWNDGKELSFELQDVDQGTHPTWVTGDQAACTAFENAVAASIPV